MDEYLWPFPRNIISHHGKLLGLDLGKVPVNTGASEFAETLAKAWLEYDDPRSVST